MKQSILAAVWIFTLAAVAAEVYSAQAISERVIATVAVSFFAFSQAAAVVVFYMNLREEPGSMWLLVLVPIMFLSGLLVSLVASLG